MGRCTLLITHIRNWHKTTTVTTTSRRSHEMAISLARYRNSTSVTRFMKLRLRCLDEMRRVYFTRVSTQLVFVTSIKQQWLPQLVISHVKMTVSLGPQGTLVTGTKTKPITAKSISKTRVVNLHLRCLNQRATLWGPLVSTGNGLLRCPLLCWHVCNGCYNH
jgi:hypothetical protein